MGRLIRMFIVLSALCSTLQAQQPAMHEHLAHYQDAQALYEKGKYGAAKSAFYRLEQKLARLSSVEPLVLDLKADVAFLQGMCSFHLLNGDANALLKDFVEKYPTHPKTMEAMFFMAKNAYIRKDYVAALEPLSKLDGKYLNKEQVTEARFMEGYGFYRKGDTTKAKERFAIIRNAEGAYGEMGAYYYAVIAYQEKDYANALSAFGRVKPDAKYAENLDVLKASCLLKLGKYEELDAMGERLLADPSNADLETWYILANSSYERAKWVECLRYFGEFESRKGKMNREGQYRMGHAFYKTGDHAKARERFEKALNPEDAVAQSAYYYLGHCFLKLEKFENARTAFLQASEEPYNKEIAGEALYLYAKASFETRYFDDALEAMRRFIEGWPKSPYLTDAKSLIGEMLVYTSDYKGAIDYLDENGGAKTPRAQVAYQRACYLYAVQQFEKNRFDIAADYFRKAFNNRQDPEVTLPAYYWYAESLFRKQDYAKANEAFDTFLKQPYAGKSPYYALAYYGLGWTEMRLKNLPEALVGFEKYLALADRQKNKELYTDAMLRSGDCEFMLKHYPEAMKYYKQVRDYNNMQVDYALFQLGKLHFRLDEYQKAAETFVQLVTNHRKSAYRDQALMNAADMYLTWLNDPTTCIKYCKMLQKDHPDSPLNIKALAFLAVAEERNGNLQQAILYNKTIAFDFCSDENARATALNSLSDKLSSEEYDKVEAESRKRCPFVSAGGTNPEAEALALTIADQRYFEDNFNSASERYTQFIADFPASKKKYHAYYYRGQCMEKLKQQDKALEDYKMVYEDEVVNEFCAKALRASAEIHANRGNNLAAMELYEKMEGKSGKLEDRLSAQFGRANIHLSNKDYEAARREFQSIYTDANTTEYSRMRARVQLAVCDYHLNRKDVALKEFSEIESLDKKVFGAESQYYITRILYDRGAFEQCRDTAIYLKNTYPAYNQWKAKAYLVLAEAYLSLGDTLQAVKGTLRSLADQDAYPQVQKEAQKRLDEISKVWTGMNAPSEPLNEDGLKEDAGDLIEEGNKQ